MSEIEAFFRLRSLCGSRATAAGRFTGGWSARCAITSTPRRRGVPGGKGLWHIKASDEVTQWETVQAVPCISEAYLLLVIERILHRFPFAILNFHTEKGEITML